MIRFRLKEQIAEKEFHEARRVTLLEIAEATGVGRITLSRMLKPGAIVRTDTLDRLCAYFKCDLQGLAEFLPDETKKLGSKVAVTKRTNRSKAGLGRASTRKKS